MKNCDRIFGLLAVLAVVIYMLACGSRPAWSPDSTRVVFAFYDQRAETTGLALYDLRTKQTSRIFETEEEMSFQPVWLGQKEQVIALAARGEKTLDIIHIDLATGEDRVIKTMASKEAYIALMVPPVLVDGRYLFFSGKLGEKKPDHGLHRLDLKSDKLTTVADSTDHVLYKIGQEYFYLAYREDAVELGTMNTERLKFRRLAMLDRQTYGEVIPSLTGTKDGSAFAMVAKREAKGQEQLDTAKEDQEQFVVVIIDRHGKLLKEIPLPAGTGCTEATHLVYGPKEKSLWVPALAPLEPKEDEGDKDSEEYKFLLLEVDIERGNCYQVLEEYMGKDGAHFMQPSISPDGKYLAVEVLVPKGEENSLLYLVDLTSPERNVTRVSLPPEPTPATQPADEQ